MITANFRQLFEVIAETAASLTGLLFVAISLAPDRKPNSQDSFVQGVRAAAAYLALVNALVVSIFALVPGTQVGYPAVVLGVIGLFFTAAAVRSMLSRRLTARLRNSQIGLLVMLLLTFGFQIDSGISLLVDPHNAGMLAQTSDVLIVSLIIGVARSWELVGRRQTGLFSSIGLLWGRDRKAQGGLP